MDNRAMNLPAMIKEIGRGAKGARSLTAEQAEALFGAMLDGEVPDLELGAIVIALRVKSESLD
jgi:anthranilate phosphoribosyltransferase